MNEKELVEAAISILHDTSCEDALPPRDRQGASILCPTDVLEVINQEINQTYKYILVHEHEKI